MSNYQVLARKYRPKRFSEVIGQEVVVCTLLNALQLGKTAHAYLFCGSRGTGKTTLARIFAKALNCKSSVQGEPCNQCSSCQEITGSYSMDVLEIDGASHRGIEDIRQINETIGYAPSGNYKIYLIDEVHMLTKEAFNALLKTLEEPPERVKFFFATTEPHKIPATILSRCQRFNLRRIPVEKIQQKLSAIAQDLEVTIHPEALHLIAELSEGGLRDAESLLDQALVYSEKELTLEILSSALGILPREMLFSLEASGQKGDYKKAFSLAKQVFSAGVHIPYFLEQLLLHFRTLLLLKVGATPSLSEEMLKRYQAILPSYTEPQCLDILEMITQAEQQIKFAPSEHIALEMLLLRILRTHQKIPFEKIVQRLSELEKKLLSETAKPITEVTFPKKKEILRETTPSLSISEDPNPRIEELPKKTRAPTTKTSEVQKSVQKSSPEKAPLQQQEISSVSLSPEEMVRQQSKLDTLMRFAAKELDGSIPKHPEKQMLGK